MAGELLTPRLRRLIVDLFLMYAMFTYLDRAQGSPLRRVLSVPQNRRAEIRLLYGLPAQLLILPFYLDFAPNDLKYEWFVSALRTGNPTFDVNQARGDQVISHVYLNEFRGTTEKRAEYHVRLLKMASTQGAMLLSSSSLTLWMVETEEGRDVLGEEPPNSACGHSGGIKLHNDSPEPMQRLRIICSSLRSSKHDVPTQPNPHIRGLSPCVSPSCGYGRRIIRVSTPKRTRISNHFYRVLINTCDARQSQAPFNSTTAASASLVPSSAITMPRSTPKNLLSTAQMASLSSQ